MSAIKNFIKQNANPTSLATSAAFNLGDLTSADHKLRGLLNTLKDIALWPLQARIGFAGLFSGMQKSIRSLVHDTGSLEAALKKLSKIQELQKIFTPLVGGAKAAKTAVAEMVNFAASKNLKLESVAEGAKNLQVMTRGVYAGMRALEEMNNAAQDTGNSLEDVTSATGEFYSTLREGASIKGAAERMREMGLISQGAADRLTLFQETGAKTQETFDELAKSMAKFKGGNTGVAGAQSSLAGAKRGLQEAFGSPFAADDVKNTQNFADAFKSITPAVSELAGFFNKLIGGLGTITSQFAKWASESPKVVSTTVLLVEALGGLVALVSGIAAVGLAGWLIGTAAGMTLFAGATGTAAVALGALGIAIRVAMGAAGIGILITLIGTVISVTSTWTSEAERNQKALQDQKDAMKEFNSALTEQINGITTLIGLEEALTKARRERKDAEDKLKNAPLIKKEHGSLWSELTNPTTMFNPLQRLLNGEEMIQDPKLAQAAFQKDVAVKALEKVNRSTLSKGPEYVAMMVKRSEDERLLTEEGRGSNLDTLVKRAQIARAGEIAQRNVRAGYLDPLNAPDTSSVYLNAMARKAGISGAQQDMYLSRAKLAEEEEGRAGELERAALSGQRGALRGAYGENIAGQIQRTELSGSDAGRYRSAAAAAESYDKLRGIYGDGEEATRRAIISEQNSIRLGARGTNASINAAAAVTDLARIGGGGNVEAANGQLDLTKRLLDVETDTRNYVKLIYEKGGGTLLLK